MSRFRRKIVACFAIGLLLFAQFAVAGYTCPTMNHGTMPSGGQLTSVKPCHDSGPKNLNLCKQHCDQAAQSVDRRVQSQTDVPVLPVVVVVFQPHTRLSGTRLAWADLAVKFTKPHLYLQHCRFLI